MAVYIVRLHDAASAGTAINVVVSADCASDAITNAIRYSAHSEIISAKVDELKNAMVDGISFGWTT